MLVNWQACSRRDFVLRNHDFYISLWQESLAIAEGAVGLQNGGCGCGFAGIWFFGLQWEETSVAADARQAILPKLFIEKARSFRIFMCHS